MDTQCPEGINHAVVMVGYGHDDEKDQDYWLLRNSWAEQWGEKGYFRYKRDGEQGPGVCSVLTLGAFPTL